jgi:hypothetical protein
MSISHNRLKASTWSQQLACRSQDLGSPAFKDYREQLVLTDHAGNLRKGKEGYQYDEHHKTNEKYPLDASSAQCR